MRSAVRLTWSVVWHALAAVLILAALLLSLFRLLLPIASDYRVELQAALGNLVQRPVRVEAVTAGWRRSGPVVELEGIDLFDPDGELSLLRFERAYINLDVIASLRKRRPVLGKLNLSGVSLRVVRREDGRIFVAGFDTPAADATPAAEELLVDWLLTQQELAIENAELHWRDRTRATDPMHLSAVSLRLRNDGDRHQLQAEVRFPTGMGGRLRVAADFTGEFGKLGSWKGRLYAEGEQLDLADLQVWSAPNLRLDEGYASFTAWSDWEGGLPQNVDGFFALLDVRLGAVADREQTVFERLAGELTWQRGEQDAWAMYVNRLAVVRTDGAWPETYLRLSGAPATGDIKLRAGYVRIEDLSSLLLSSTLIGDELTETLAAMRPSGEVRNLSLDYAPRKGGAERLRVHAAFTDLSYKGIGKIPSVAGLDGIVQHDGDQGFAEFETEGLELAVGDMFRRPIQADRLSGAATWHYANGAWRVSADHVLVDHDDLQAQVRMHLEVPDDGSSPILDLMVWYGNGRVDSASRYYPVSIMSTEVVDWLDRSLVSGKVVWGGLVLRGQLKDFPFDKHEGKFEVRFHLADAIIDYAPGWPRAEEVEAEVVFEGRRMDIDAVAGKILGSDVMGAHIEIPELRSEEAVLKVTGEARGAASGIVNFLSASPLDQMFGNYLLGTKVSGRSHLSLSLTLPLGAQRARVKGALTLEDTMLARNGWEIQLDNVHGVLHFTESELYARALRARVLGKSARIDIETEAMQPSAANVRTRNALVFNVASRMDVAEIPDRFQRQLSAFAHGSADYRVRLVVPEVEWRDQVRARLTIESDLQGLAVDLPAPFGKTAAESRSFRVSTDLLEDSVGLAGVPHRLITMSYGNDINAGFIVQETPQGVVVERGQVACRSGIGNLPEPGVRISGELPALDADEWRGFLGRLEKVQAGARGGVILKQISGIDLHVGELRLLQRRFSDADLTLAREGSQWVMAVESPNLSGNVKWHDDIQSKPIEIDLERVIVLEPGGETPLALDVDPRKLPLVKVSADRIIYRDIDLGHVEIETSRNPNGLKIERLAVEVEAGQISGTGDWVVVDDQQFTRMDIRFTSDSLGQTLASFGFSGAVAGGETKSQLIAQWPGGPADFSTANFNGTINMVIKKGQFLDVEPGAGRVFGLLSIQTLPRRLALDFSDLFKRGFAFDSVSGEFAIEDGNAFTNALTMEGPAARIDISGRTGLADRDYDQFVTVTPKLTGGSLPLAGALFGGPVVGAAILAIEQVFKPAIEEISRYHYTIKGTWEEPRIEPLSKEELRSQPVS